MSRQRLIGMFSEREILPVDLDEVAAWIVEKGIQNEINFVGVELQVGVIRGFLKRFRRHKGGWDPEPDDVSSIYYDNRQPMDWQNIVRAKELLHIMDGACVSTKAEFEKLTQRLSLPDDMRHLLEDPAYALVDKFGTAPACALLLPLAAREVLLPAYTAGIITAADIAKQAVMPTEHVRTVMSDHWPAIHGTIMSQWVGEDRPYDRAEAPGELAVCTPPERSD